MQRFLRVTVLIICGIFLGFSTHSQGLENVIVERYYVSDAADAAGSSGVLPTGSVTYRIYVDMVPGYNFQALYGVTGHYLTLSTTTSFFNNEDYGNTSPNSISATNIRKNTAMLDSWFSVGAACNGKLGVLKTEDTDGSVGNANSILANTDPSAGSPVSITDGMVAGTTTSVTFVGIGNTGNGDLAVLDGLSQLGNLFTTNNGSVAALGGVSGPTTSNAVLVAQITTDGVFSFELNIQIGTPTGGIEQYVASNPVGNEIQFPGLIYTSSSTSASFENISSDILGIHPNPSNGLFTMNIPESAKYASDVSCDVYSATGCRLFSNTLASAEGRTRFEIDLSGFPTGMYFLFWKEDEKTIVEKLIKL